MITLKCPACDQERYHEDGKEDLIWAECEECDRIYPYPLLCAMHIEGHYVLKLRNDDLVYFTSAQLQSEDSQGQWVRLTIAKDFWGLERAYVRLADIVWCAMSNE